MERIGFALVTARTGHQILRHFNFKLALNQYRVIFIKCLGATLHPHLPVWFIHNDSIALEMYRNKIMTSTLHLCLKKLKSMGHYLADASAAGWRSVDNSSLVTLSCVGANQKSLNSKHYFANDSLREYDPICFCLFYLEIKLVVSMVLCVMCRVVQNVPFPKQKMRWCHGKSKTSR